MSDHGLSQQELQQIGRAAAETYGIDVDLFFRLIQQESAWQVGALSPKGASGIAQFMSGTWTDVINAHPEIAEHFRIDSNPLHRQNPGAALFASAAHLRDLFDSTSGTPDQRIRDMLVGYNAGAGRMGTPTAQLPEEREGRLH